MSKYIKRQREIAGLTQEKLAEKMGVTPQAVQNWESGRTRIDWGKLSTLSEVLNVPREIIVNELLIEEDNENKNLDNWPSFLFDDETNKIIDTLHLNLAQQDLFGLLYIYDSEYVKKKILDFYTLEDDLKKIPYGFIDKVGSIQFMNQADGLHQVVKYVKADFLMRVLKLNPEVEFNIKRLSKNLICEFVDSGYKEVDDTDSFDERFEGDDAFYLRISMRKARIMLPLLKKYGPVHITDDRWANPIREDIPEDVLAGILEMCCFKSDLFKDGYYKDTYNITSVRHGLEEITDYYEDKEKKWLWKINEKGEKLLEWFQDG
ncbi:MAG: helix-turn-helix domain-containing protein [Eubacterium sp.]|nr:helix-turn-helix domain-containing protein [Eubacterium sp.]